MAIQLSVLVRNARLDAIETAIGVSAKLKIFTGPQPATCAANDTGTVLATVDLPADWMQNAAGGQKTIAGSWVDMSADAGGTAAHYRVYATNGTTCHLQGSVSASGGGGDMLLDNVVLAAGQEFRVEAFSLTDANA